MVVRLTYSSLSFYPLQKASPQSFPRFIASINLWITLGHVYIRLPYFNLAVIGSYWHLILILSGSGAVFRYACQRVQGQPALLRFRLFARVSELCLINARGNKVEACVSTSVGTIPCTAVVPGTRRCFVRDSVDHQDHVPNIFTRQLSSPLSQSFPCSSTSDDKREFEVQGILCSVCSIL